MNKPAPLEPSDREELLFHAAAQLRDPAKRALYLDWACEGNPELRARVEKLLANDSGDNFFAQPLASPAAFSRLPAETLSAAVQEQGVGERIGRYKLLQKIGEGGCGIVYMAEQEEPVRRRVALKIIRLGMDTQSVIARFEAERQALALMDHPNIAKILDGGVTETGRPYFVMDLVQGLPIIQFCDEVQLPTKERLALFMEVCSAIQHAHQKGIIHRDIKPSNILVTLHGEKPVPKVIDFGIAKATQQRLTDKTLFTQFQHFIGTPAYMSPEQATLSGLDIDTRSDIYSLGVLLYELLTGKTPFDSKELLQAGVDEMCRTIREKEPPTPSTRLYRERQAARSARAGKSEIQNPKSEIDKDLDWIVMKCLEKDRARRYETANGLAMDIQRHLNNEPVVASPPSRIYRLQKMVRRNSGLFAAATMIVALLVLAAGISTWEAVGARQAERGQVRLREAAEASSQREAGLRQQALANEKKAQTEAAKNQEVARLLKDMLTSVGASKAQGRDTTMLHEILDKTAERVTKGLTNEPEVQLELLAVLGDTYRGLGLYTQMEGAAEVELKVARAVFGEEHPGVAAALNRLGVAQRYLWKTQEAERTLNEALALRRRLFGEENLDTADTLNNLAIVLWDHGQLAESEDLARQALAVRRRLLGEQDPQVAKSVHTLASVFWRRGDLREAEKLFRHALELERKLWGNEHPQVAMTLANLGLVLFQERRMADAEPMMREALAVDRTILGDAHPNVASDVANLIALLHEQGKDNEAEALLNTLLTPPLETRWEGIGLLKLRAGFHVQRGRWREAVVDFEKALELDPTDHILYTSIIPVLVANGQIDSYHKFRQKMLARFAGTRDGGIADRVAKASLLLVPSGEELTAACALADLAVRVNGAEALPWSQFCKGLACYRQGQFAAAATWASKALDHPGIAWQEAGARALDLEAYALIAMSQYRLERLNEAHVELAKAEQTLVAEFPDLPAGDWADVLYGQTLLNEAKTLIQGQNGTVVPAGELGATNNKAKSR